MKLARIIAGVASLLAAAPAVSADSQYTVVTLLHTNDLHGAVTTSPSASEGVRGRLDKPY